MVIKLSIQKNDAAPDAQISFDQTFDVPIVTIGSDEAATLQLDVADAAPEQAVLISEADQLLLINRADGTLFNDEMLPRQARRPLTPGDRLQIGEYTVSLVPNQADAREAREAREEESAPVDTPATSGHSANKTLNADHATATPAPLVPSLPTPPQSFAAILDSLRTEEDSFYFLVEGGAQSGLRIPVESAEMLLGWDEAGQNICFDHADLAATRAVVRKDWSGVVVQAQTTWMITVNGEMVESLRRLRNGDRVALAPVKKVADQREPLLIFHEPASLMVLDSLLPQRFPPPVPLQPAATTTSTIVSSSGTPTTIATVMPVADKAKESKAAGLRRRIFEPDRKYLGYYTLLDLTVFSSGTLVATLVVYLILHFTS